MLWLRHDSELSTSYIIENNKQHSDSISQTEVLIINYCHAINELWNCRWNMQLHSSLPEQQPVSSHKHSCTLCPKETCMV